MTASRYHAMRGESLEDLNTGDVRPKRQMTAPAAHRAQVSPNPTS